MIILLRILAILLLTCSSVLAQNYPVRHFTVQDGLPSNTVYYVYRDSHGFLWVCTDKGVARYNGIGFEKFTTFHGLADNDIFAACEDGEGRLWFSTYNGDLCFYKNDSFHNPGNTPFLRQKRKEAHIQKMFPQKDGSIIFMYNNGNYFCYVEKDRCVGIELDSIGGVKVYRGFARKETPKQFSIISRDRRYQIDVSDKKEKLLSVEDISGQIDSGVVNDVHFCQGQNYFNTEIALYSTDLKLIRRFPKGFSVRNEVYQVYTSDDGSLFCGTDHGLFINDTVNILRPERISCITQDVIGNYWVSTLGNGLFSLSKSFAGSTLTEAAYKGVAVYARAVGKKVYYCTSENILYGIGCAKGELFSSDDGQAVNRIPMSVQYIDYRSRYWFVSVNKGLRLKNLVSGATMQKPIDVHVPSIVSLKEAVESDGVLYVNTSTGVVALDMDDVYKKDKLECNVVFHGHDSRVFDIAATPDGVRFSTISGVFLAQRDAAVPDSKYKNYVFRKFAFWRNALIGITGNNYLLVCKEGNGQVKLDTIIRDCVWENIYVLDSDHVLVTSNGPNYLLSTVKTSFSVSVVEDPFIPLAAELVYASNGQCYFFKNGTVTTLGKDRLLRKAALPILSFRSVKTNKGRYRVDSVVEIPYEESENIKISFSALSFGSGDVAFQYSLSGGDIDRWTNVDGDINLANAAFGSYYVKVRARTNGGDFCAPIAFRLNILRPYWATWWFGTLCALSVVFLIYWLVKARTRASLARREKEHQDQVRFIRSEYKAMNALMNPHFIFNALNNVQGLVNSDDKLNASEYLGIFANLVRQNMHNINSETIPLQKEMELVENYLLLEKLRFEDQLSYSIEVEGGLFLSEVMVPALLVQPLVENSIKHGILPLKSRGGTGVICLRLFEKEGMLVIEVRDNGVGLTAGTSGTTLHKSYGLENLRNRIQQLSILQERSIQFQLAEETDEGGQRWTVAHIGISLS